MAIDARTEEASKGHLLLIDSKSEQRMHSLIEQASRKLKAAKSEVRTELADSDAMPFGTNCKNIDELTFSSHLMSAVA